MNKMTGKSWVKVAIFEESNEAQALETFFKRKGIDARTYNDKMLRLFLFLRRRARLFEFRFDVALEICNGFTGNRARRLRPLAKGGSLPGLRLVTRGISADDA